MTNECTTKYVIFIDINKSGLDSYGYKILKFELEAHK